MSGWGYIGMSILLYMGVIVMIYSEVIRLLGWEWLRCQFERIWRRRDDGRPDDDDEDPRGGFGGLAS